MTQSSGEDRLCVLQARIIHEPLSRLDLSQLIRSLRLFTITKMELLGTNIPTHLAKIVTLCDDDYHYYYYYCRVGVCTGTVNNG